MANARFFNADGYGQFEPNNVWFTRTGAIEAQCKLSSDFSATLPLENGMLVVVDKVAGAIALAKQTETRPFGIVYTHEATTNQFAPGLKNFKMEDNNGFYPRVGYLSVGETFTTNCVAADTAVYSNEAALLAALASNATVPMYGGYTTDLGAIVVSTVAPTAGPVLGVVKKTTMADGQNAIKFTVLSV